jgi:hypothetical protein
VDGDAVSPDASRGRVGVLSYAKPDFLPSCPELSQAVTAGRVVRRLSGLYSSSFGSTATPASSLVPFPMLTPYHRHGALLSAGASHTTTLCVLRRTSACAPSLQSTMLALAPARTVWHLLDVPAPACHCYIS